MSKYLCESCDHGYKESLTACPWCGAPTMVAYVSNETSCMDTECYHNYWLCAFDTGEYFELCDDHPLDIAGLILTLSRYTLVTFNGINYDIPMITAAISGCTNTELKALSDRLIVGGEKHWNIVKSINWIDHIDLIEVAPGQGGLKAYGAKLHTRKLQDLPYHPGLITEWYHKALLREYCKNDLTVTRELFTKLESQIKLREEMSKQYGIDLRSKSDAQIAETVLKKLLPFKPEIPYIPPGTAFNYRPPEWLEFVNLPVLDMVRQSTFVISDSGGVTMPDELAKTYIEIGNSRYKMGIGGLHSTESNASYVANDDYVLRDHDVTGMYPNMMINLSIAPAQLGNHFRTIFKGWVDSRTESKHKAQEIKKQLKELKK